MPKPTSQRQTPSKPKQKKNRKKKSNKKKKKKKAPNEQELKAIQKGEKEMGGERRGRFKFCFKKRRFNIINNNGNKGERGERREEES